MNPAFTIAREIGTNLSQGFNKVKDENAIEGILSQAMQSGDPQVLQDSIGKILSQVSPERQGPALQYLQNAYSNVQKKQEQQQQFKRETEAGLVPGINPTSQAAIYKEGQKGKRLEDANQLFNRPSAANQNQMPAEQQQGNVAEIKQQLLSLTGHPDREVSERAKAELRNIEAEQKQDRADLREAKKETLPLRMDIAKRAEVAQQGIMEKNKMIDLINTGKINDPTYATLLNAIPMKLGQRMLSPETVEYKASLVNGYRDLRNIFTGTTRVKEIELLEDKVADLYLTDEQKKAILRSSLNTLQYDILRAEAAAEVEQKHPGLNVLEYSKKVDAAMKPRLESLSNRVIDEQKSIIKDAENRKKIALNYDDPEGRQILEQLLKEANGDRTKARELAKKKGYIVGK